MPRLERAWLKGLAGAGLAAVLFVVVESAAIRLSAASSVPFVEPAALGALRLVHRGAASLGALAALAVAVIAWRGRRAYGAAAAVALGLAGLLAVIGILGGERPPPLAALGNVVCGVGLAAAFAWILGAAGRRAEALDRWWLPGLAGALFTSQILMGAGASVLGREPALLVPVHALLGLLLAGALGWLAFGRARYAGAKPLAALGVVAVAAGLAALLDDASSRAAFCHAATAAAFTASVAWGFGRNA